MPSEEDPPELEIREPLHTGIKRKRIEFVAEGKCSIQTDQPLSPSSSAGDRYLSIVFKHGSSMKDVNTVAPDSSYSPATLVKQTHSDLADNLCKICNLPVDNTGRAEITTTIPHETSIAHMVCLKHSHPPSHLDRNRVGLQYLSSYGWDPDSRLGLGASGEGIRAPIKAKMKHDTVGLGVDLSHLSKVQKKKVEILDAKQARKKSLDDRKKGKKLQEIFYGNDDVEKYLGGL